MGAGRLSCKVLPVLMGLMAATVVRYRFRLISKCLQKAQFKDSHQTCLPDWLSQQAGIPA
jgi:hypothetical protein